MLVPEQYKQPEQPKDKLLIIPDALAEDCNHPIGTEII